MGTVETAVLQVGFCFVLFFKANSLSIGMYVNAYFVGYEDDMPEGELYLIMVKDAC